MLTASRTLIWILLALLLTWPTEATGQARTPVPSNQGIPKGSFRSWSLFLVCDPAWLHPDKNKVLQELRYRYWLFADTTGPRHAATWFTKDLSDEAPLDIDRMRTYCQLFNLVPTDGPHILVTNIHPDQGPVPVADARVLVSLKGSIDEAQERLSTLNKQLLLEKLSQHEIDSADWWLGFARAIDSACQWLKGMEWSVQFKVLNIKRTGVCT